MNKKANKKLWAVFFGLFIVVFIIFVAMVPENQKISNVSKNNQNSPSISEEKDRELFDLAIIHNNNQYCQGIMESELKSSCLALFTGKTEYKTADDELLDLAIIKNSAEECKKIQSAEIRQSCINLFKDVKIGSAERDKDKENYDSALINHDIAYCAQISDSELRKSCIALF